MLLESEMPVTAISPESLVTFTVTVAVLPLLDLAVTVAVPAPLAVILPFDTVATDLLEDVHVTVLLVALSGFTVAVTVVLWPTTRFVVVLESVMPVASMEEETKLIPS